LALAAAACAPEIPYEPPTQIIVARFDPAATPPIVPTPNDLVTNPTTGLLNVPIPSDASGADRSFYEWLNTLTGFPASASASATFSNSLNPASITPTSVRVIDLTANNAPVDVARTYTNTLTPSAPGVLTVQPPTGGWTAGHRYAVMILGGPNGLKGNTGLPVAGSATWALIRNEGELVDCPDDNLASDTCRLATEVIPSSVTNDPAARLADQLNSAKRLETLRRRYRPAIEVFVSQGVRRADIALLWTFKIDDSASVVFDPANTPPRVPTPNNLALRSGMVNAPIDPNASEATKEWTRTWLNTLNGFPAASPAGADIVGADLEPGTLSSQSVRVLTLAGTPLDAAPVISYNSTLKRLTVTPPNGSWGTAKTIAVVVVGGTSGVKGTGEKRVVASQVWALVRSASPLVDCDVLGPSCNSLIRAAPISATQAVALENLRRAYEPLLNGLAANGVPRRDVAAAWIFSTIDQPELVFDPAAVPPRIPTPTDLAINPMTGRLNLPVPAGASAAYAEFITDYLNTLDGFPVSSSAVAEIGGSVEPSTINSNTVRVLSVAGGALSGAPSISFDSATSRLTVGPPNGSWGKGRTIAVAVVGGPAGVRSMSGHALTASQAFSFVRLSSSLVDDGCSTVGPSCRSVVALSDAQAVALEPVRRGLKPVFDAFENRGVSRQNIAGLWVFRTVSFPELTFDLGQGVVPFPNNQLLRGNTLPDGGVQSGFVVVLPDGGAPGDDTGPNVRLSLPIPPGASVAQAQLIAGLNTLDGFSTTAPIVSENGATQSALDTGSIDAGTLASGTGFIKLLGGGAMLADGGASVRVCLNCASSLNDAGLLDQPEQLQWVPENPLEESSRYAAFVTTALHSTQGKPVMAAPTFALVRLKNPLVDGNATSTVPVISNAQAVQLEPVRQRFRECLDRIEASGRPRKDIALGFCLTTQSITAPIRAIAAGINASPIPTAVLWMVDVTLPTRAGLTMAQIPTANVGRYLEGEVVLPFALTGPGGTFNPNSSAWQARPARFTLTLPTSMPPGAGYPTAFFGHGLTRSRSDMLLLADALAQGGLASIAIDTPFHGDRSDCRGLPAPDAACANPATQECSLATGRCVARASQPSTPCDLATTGNQTCFAAGLGRCLPSQVCEGGRFAADPLGNVLISGNQFLNLVNLFAARDNFRHAGAADFTQLVRVVSATGTGTLNARLAADGLGTLDATQVHYVGQSLGSFNGTVFSVSNAAPRRMVLNVAGSDQVEVLLTSPGFATQRAGFLAGLAATGVFPGTAGFDNFIVLARTILDPADPQNLLRAGVDSTNANRRIFVPYIAGDVVLPNSGTQKLLRAARTAQQASRLAWFQFSPHQGMATAGQFPASWPITQRHGFMLSPGGSPGSVLINPECDPTNASQFNAMTCATAVSQRQVTEFLAAQMTPANFPVNP
jgi:hypothetical protein